MICRFIGIFAFAVSGLFSQEQPVTPPPDAAAATKPATPPAEAALTPAAPAAIPKPDYVIDPGTKIPLSLINSVSTKNSTEGDRVYLETVFPVVLRGKMVIPVGSYVAGTVTKVTRPGRVKGRGEFYIRFDSLTLPNGVTRDFRASIGSLDGRASEDLDRKEGSIKSEGNKSGDVRTIAETAASGASIGAVAGGVAAGRPGMGAGIGAAAGATAGLIGVLVTRGPDAVLARGTTMEMVLDRPIGFTESDVDFSKAYMGGSGVGNGPGPGPSAKDKRASRWPF
jgi:type IV secretion system protein VirB10